MACVVMVVVATDDYCLFQKGKRERKIRLLKLKRWTFRRLLLRRRRRVRRCSVQSIEANMHSHSNNNSSQKNEPYFLSPNIKIDRLEIMGQHRRHICAHTQRQRQRQRKISKRTSKRRRWWKRRREDTESKRKGDNAAII